MNHTNIIIGQTLILKKERQEDYGMASPLVKISGFKEKSGYKSFWVISVDENGEKQYYKPSDFLKPADLLDSFLRTQNPQ